MTKKPIVAWARFEDGKLAWFETMVGYHQSAETLDIFRNKKVAKMMYEDVRKVEIREFKLK